MAAELDQGTLAASLPRLLLEIARQTRQGKRPYVRTAAGVKISTSPEGARILLADLQFWAQPQNSMLAQVLRALANAKLTRWKATRDAINALLAKDAPWISAFAKRLASGHGDASDGVLLRKILSAADRAGYGRAEFFRRDKSDRLLMWPLQAFLIEHCLGGGHWWTNANLVSPMHLVRLQKQRRGADRDAGWRNIYQHYLGSGWRAVVTAQPRPGYIPRRLRNL